MHHFLLQCFPVPDDTSLNPAWGGLFHFVEISLTLVRICFFVPVEQPSSPLPPKFSKLGEKGYRKKKFAQWYALVYTDILKKKKYINQRYFSRNLFMLVSVSFSYSSTIHLVQVCKYLEIRQENTSSTFRIISDNFQQDSYFTSQSILQVFLHVHS